MTTLLEDAQSVENSNPREGYEIKHGTTVYRIASGSRNELIGGNVYQSYPAMRGSYGVAAIGHTGDLELKLPTSHPLVQRWYANGIPPRLVLVTAWRKQQRSGEAERFFLGQVESISVDGHIASLLIPSLVSGALKRPLPMLTVGKLCPHVLYDAQCRVPRADFRVVTAVTLSDGDLVRVASMAGKPDGWADIGELVHVPSGERMTIRSQIGNDIHIQLPIFELGAGDAVEVYAGCPRDILTCDDKFDNRQNFGGLPSLPTVNPLMPNGFGVWTSE